MGMNASAAALSGFADFLNFNKNSLHKKSRAFIKRAGNACNKNEISGVWGGMGPLAWAESFLALFMRKTAGRPEQESPIVYLISDPTISDRTGLWFAV
jgi:hypothetical protein